MKHSYLSLFSFRNLSYLPHSFNVKHHFGFKARTDFFVVNILHKIKICKLILTTKNTNHYCVEIDIALQREINLWLDTKYCLFKHTYTHLNKILVPPKCQIIIISTKLRRVTWLTIVTHKLLVTHPLFDVKYTIN